MLQLGSERIYSLARTFEHSQSPSRVFSCLNPRNHMSQKFERHHLLGAKTVCLPK